MTAPANSPRVRRAAPAKTKSAWPARAMKYAAALPAVLAIVGTLIFAAMALGHNGEETELQYQADAAADLDAGQFRNARILYLRLLQKHQGDPELMFGLARALLGCSEFGAAQSLLNYLAPVNADGYPPAQLFLAQIMLQDPKAPANAKALAEKHLNRVLEKEPQNIDAKILLAQIHSTAH